jgi:hypothetical protein
MPPLGGITFPPCTFCNFLMFNGAVASPPLPGFFALLYDTRIQMAFIPGTPKEES